MDEIVLDELTTSSSLDEFFNDQKTLTAMYNMMHIGPQTFSAHTLSMILCAYNDNGVLSKQYPHGASTIVRRTSKYFSVAVQKFPIAIWTFYCRSKHILWKEDVKFCTTLQQYFSMQAQANDKRCDFASMSNAILNDHAAMMQLNSFMN